MESRLQRLEWREWWLWLSALVVTIPSGIAFLLSSFRAQRSFLRNRLPTIDCYLRSVEDFLDTSTVSRIPYPT
jgi:hypothetical protein